MAIGTLVFDKSSYETVLCLGLLLDGEGRKMSKHLGNVLDPFELFDRHGADAVRWLMLAGGSPWMDRRVGHENVEEVVRKVLLTYYNTASFFLLYASTSDWTPERGHRADGAAARARPVGAQRARRDRRRGRRGAGGLRLGAGRQADRRASSTTCPTGTSAAPAAASGPATRQALATLHQCLETVTRLMAPLTPFLTDWLWPQLAVPDAPDSVHLARWPRGRRERWSMPGSRRRSTLVRRLVELGRAARAGAKVKTRQPLARAAVPGTLLSQLSGRAAPEIADELNVLVVEPLDGELVDIVVKPNFRALGKRFGPRTKAVADAVAAAGQPVDGRLTVSVDGEQIELSGRRADRHRDAAGRAGRSSANRVLRWRSTSR